jgi:hypothetical protein
MLLVARDECANGEKFIATDGKPYSSRENYNAMCSVIGKLIPKWSVPKIYKKESLEILFLIYFNE